MLPGVEERRVSVDGQDFRVHDGEFGGMAFDWLNGKNPGYGFGSSWPSAQTPTLEELRAAIRVFLAQVDPVTGYIEADDTVQ